MYYYNPYYTILVKSMRANLFHKSRKSFFINFNAYFIIDIIL